MAANSDFERLVFSVLHELGYSDSIVDHIEMLPSGHFIVRYKANAVTAEDVSRITDRLNAYIFSSQGPVER